MGSTTPTAANSQPIGVQFLGNTNIGALNVTVVVGALEQYAQTARHTSGSQVSDFLSVVALELDQLAQAWRSISRKSAASISTNSDDFLDGLLEQTNHFCALREFWREIRDNSSTLGSVPERMLDILTLSIDAKGGLVRTISRSRYSAIANIAMIEAPIDQFDVDYMARKNKKYFDLDILDPKVDPSDKIMARRFRRQYASFVIYRKSLRNEQREIEANFERADEEARRYLFEGADLLLTLSGQSRAAVAIFAATNS